MPSPPALLSLGPDWQALYAAAGTADQRALVETLAARALTDRGSAVSVDALPELASDAEIGTLAAFLETLARRQRDAADPYERHKARTAQVQRDKSTAGREIGPLPAVADPERRAACVSNLGLFLATYFPRAFSKPFCAKQRTMIQRIQVALLVGALFAFAVDRGCGKTTISIRSLIWSQLYRHHRFAVLIAASDEKAQKAVAAIKWELRFNPQLAADFPEVCYPIFRLDGINQRAKGQLLDGLPTLISWDDSQLVLPTVGGVPGCAIEVGGLLTAVRGAQITTSDGEILRPSAVLIDDPQTRESAKSQDQVQTRLDILLGDVLGLAGPGEPIAAVMPCTIIYRGDVADLLTDREAYPEWRGQREGIVDKLPDRLDLWEDYFEVLDQIKGVADEDDHTLQRIRAEATAYYYQHRDKMDCGCVATWPERFLPWELSAVQHAMNLYHRSESAWWAEYMNQPTDPLQAEDEFLSADEIAGRFSGYPRGVVPLACHWLTAMIDVHNRILYYAVCAWEDNFTGYVVDYGVLPDQKRPTWKAQRCEHHLKHLYEGRTLEGAMYQGITDLAATLLTTNYRRSDDQQLQIALCLIDAGDKTSVVRKVLREHPHRARMLASFGRSIGPNRRAISTYQKKDGERIGDEWLIRPDSKSGGRHVLFDDDHWKTFLHRRLATPRGDRGSLTLHGREKSPKHTFYARHLTAELRKRVVGDRPTDEWTMKPGESENHWLDTTVGCCVAASICGAQIAGAAVPGTIKRRRRTADYFTL